MHIDEELAEAEVANYVLKGNFVIYQVNVFFPDLDCRIKGITVQPSKYKDRGPWVQLPRYQDKNGKWRHPIETSGTSPLYKLVEKLAIDAVTAYTIDNYIPTESDVEKPLTVDDISFDDDSGKPSKPP